MAEKPYSPKTPITTPKKSIPRCSARVPRNLMAWMCSLKCSNNYNKEYPENAEVDNLKKEKLRQVYYCQSKYLHVNRAQLRKHKYPKITKRQSKRKICQKDNNVSCVSNLKNKNARSKVQSTCNETNTEQVNNSEILQRVINTPSVDIQNYKHGKEISNYVYSLRKIKLQNCNQIRKRKSQKSAPDQHIGQCNSSQIIKVNKRKHSITSNNYHVINNNNITNDNQTTAGECSYQPNMYKGCNYDEANYCVDKYIFEDHLQHSIRPDAYQNENLSNEDHCRYDATDLSIPTGRKCVCGERFQFNYENGDYSNVPVSEAQNKKIIIHKDACKLVDNKLNCHPLRRNPGNCNFGDPQTNTRLKVNQIKCGREGEVCQLFDGEKENQKKYFWQELKNQNFEKEFNREKQNTCSEAYQRQPGSDDSGDTPTNTRQQVNKSNSRYKDVCQLFAVEQHKAEECRYINHDGKDCDHEKGFSDDKQCITSESHQGKPKSGDNDDTQTNSPRKIDQLNLVPRKDECKFRDSEQQNKIEYSSPGLKDQVGKPRNCDSSDTETNNRCMVNQPNFICQDMCQLINSKQLGIDECGYANQNDQDCDFEKDFSAGKQHIWTKHYPKEPGSCHYDNTTTYGKRKVNFANNKQLTSSELGNCDSSDTQMNKMRMQNQLTVVCKDLCQLVNSEQPGIDECDYADQKDQICDFETDFGRGKQHIWPEHHRKGPGSYNYNNTPLNNKQNTNFVSNKQPTSPDPENCDSSDTKTNKKRAVDQLTVICKDISQLVNSAQQGIDECGFADQKNQACDHEKEFGKGGKQHTSPEHHQKELDYNNPPLYSKRNSNCASNKQPTSSESEKCNFSNIQSNQKHVVNQLNVICKDMCQLVNNEQHGIEECGYADQKDQFNRGKQCTCHEHHQIEPGNFDYDDTPICSKRNANFASNEQCRGFRPKNRDSSDVQTNKRRIVNQPNVVYTEVCQLGSSKQCITDECDYVDQKDKDYDFEKDFSEGKQCIDYHQKDPGNWDHDDTPMYSKQNSKFANKKQPTSSQPGDYDSNDTQSNRRRKISQLNVVCKDMCQLVNIEQHAIDECGYAALTDQDCDFEKYFSTGKQCTCPEHHQSCEYDYTETYSNRKTNFASKGKCKIFDTEQQNIIEYHDLELEDQYCDFENEFNKTKQRTCLEDYQGTAGLNDSDDAQSNKRRTVNQLNFARNNVSQLFKNEQQNQTKYFCQDKYNRGKPTQRRPKNCHSGDTETNKKQVNQSNFVCKHQLLKSKQHQIEECDYTNQIDQDCDLEKEFSRVNQHTCPDPQQRIPGNSDYVDIQANSRQLDNQSNFARKQVRKLFNSEQHNAAEYSSQVVTDRDYDFEKEINRGKQCTSPDFLQSGTRHMVNQPYFTSKKMCKSLDSEKLWKRSKFELQRNRGYYDSDNNQKNKTQNMNQIKVKYSDKNTICAAQPKSNKRESSYSCNTQENNLQIHRSVSYSQPQKPYEECNTLQYMYEEESSNSVEYMYSNGDTSINSTYNCQEVHHKQQNTQCICSEGESSNSDAYTCGNVNTTKNSKFNCQEAQTKVECYCKQQDDQQVCSEEESSSSDKDTSDDTNEVQLNKKCCCCKPQNDQGEGGILGCQQCICEVPLPRDCVDCDYGGMKNKIKTIKFQCKNVCWSDKKPKNACCCQKQEESESDDMCVTESSNSEEYTCGNSNSSKCIRFKCQESREDMATNKSNRCQNQTYKKKTTSKRHSRQNNRKFIKTKLESCCPTCSSGKLTDEWRIIIQKPPDYNPKSWKCLDDEKDDKCEKSTVKADNYSCENSCIKQQQQQANSDPGGICEESSNSDGYTCGNGDITKNSRFNCQAVQTKNKCCCKQQNDQDKGSASACRKCMCEDPLPRECSSCDCGGKNKKIKIKKFKCKSVGWSLVDDKKKKEDCCQQVSNTKTNVLDDSCLISCSKSADFFIDRNAGETIKKSRNIFKCQKYGEDNNNDSSNDSTGSRFLVEDSRKCLCLSDNELTYNTWEDPRDKLNSDRMKITEDYPEMELIFNICEPCEIKEDRSQRQNKNESTRCNRRCICSNCGTNFDNGRGSKIKYENTMSQSSYRSINGSQRGKSRITKSRQFLRGDGNSTRSVKNLKCVCYGKIKKKTNKLSGRSNQSILEQKSDYSRTRTNITSKNKYLSIDNNEFDGDGNRVCCPHYNKNSQSAYTLPRAKKSKDFQKREKRKYLNNINNGIENSQSTPLRTRTNIPSKNKIQISRKKSEQHFSKRNPTQHDRDEDYSDDHRPDLDNEIDYENDNRVCCPHYCENSNIPDDRSKKRRNTGDNKTHRKICSTSTSYVHHTKYLPTEFQLHKSIFYNKISQNRNPKNCMPARPKTTQPSRQEMKEPPSNANIRKSCSDIQQKNSRVPPHGNGGCTCVNSDPYLAPSIINFKTCDCDCDEKKNYRTTDNCNCYQHQKYNSKIASQQCCCQNNKKKQNNKNNTKLENCGGPNCPFVNVTDEWDVIKKPLENINSESCKKNDKYEKSAARTDNSYKKSRKKRQDQFCNNCSMECKNSQSLSYFTNKDPVKNTHQKPYNTSTVDCKRSRSLTNFTKCKSNIDNSDNSPNFLDTSNTSEEDMKYFAASNRSNNKSINYIKRFTDTSSSNKKQTRIDTKHFQCPNPVNNSCYLSNTNVGKTEILKDNINSNRLLPSKNKIKKVSIEQCSCLNDIREGLNLFEDNFNLLKCTIKNVTEDKSVGLGQIRPIQNIYTKNAPLVELDDTSSKCERVNSVTDNSSENRIYDYVLTENKQTSSERYDNCSADTDNSGEIFMDCEIVENEFINLHPVLNTTEDTLKHKSFDSRIGTCTAGTQSYINDTHFKINKLIQTKHRHKKHHSTGQK